MLCLRYLLSSWAATRPPATPPPPKPKKFSADADEVINILVITSWYRRIAFTYKI